MSFCIPELFCREPSCQKYFTKSFLWKKKIQMIIISLGCSSLWLSFHGLPLFLSFRSSLNHPFLSVCPSYSITSTVIQLLAFFIQRKKSSLPSFQSSCWQLFVASDTQLLLCCFIISWLQLLYSCSWVVPLLMKTRKEIIVFGEPWDGNPETGWRSLRAQHHHHHTHPSFCVRPSLRLCPLRFFHSPFNWRPVKPSCNVFVVIFFLIFFSHHDSSIVFPLSWHQHLHIDVIHSFISDWAGNFNLVFLCYCSCFRDWSDEYWKL